MRIIVPELVQLGSIRRAVLHNEAVARDVGFARLDLKRNFVFRVRWVSRNLRRRIAEKWLARMQPHWLRGAEIVWMTENRETGFSGLYPAPHVGTQRAGGGG